MAGDIVVRPYRPEDEPAVVKLWQICFVNEPPWNNPADVIRRKLTVQPELFLVCLSDGRLVGTVMAGFDGFRGWINRIATHPEFRRKGIASRLMNRAEEVLVVIGCPKLNIQVRTENASVVKFYQEAGYSIEDRISMSKRLE